MVIVCADCGCVVDRGIVKERCADPHCCCEDLPDAMTPAELEGTA
jgi:hypothetical protein